VDIRTVACIGVGQIGRGWALLFASRGLETRLFDNDPGRLAQALEQMRASAGALVEAGLVADADAVVARLRVSGSLQEAVAGADYVQESIAEDVALKRALFEALDGLAPPSCILGSSTSEIAGSRFMERLRHPGRALVVHPVNPPYLIPVVELCPTARTDASTVARTEGFMRSLGQEPVLVRREISGFLLNRLQMAVINEALHLVGEGYCSAADVDRTLTHGLGLRWAFMGPFETGHLNSAQGYLDYVTKFEPLMRTMAADLAHAYPWTHGLAAAIDAECQARTPADRIPERQLWRDRRLMALRRHLDAQD